MRHWSVRPTSLLCNTSEPHAALGRAGPQLPARGSGAVRSVPPADGLARTNHHPGYRCRHGQASTCRRIPDQPRNLYVREDEPSTRWARHSDVRRSCRVGSIP